MSVTVDVRTGSQTPTVGKEVSASPAPKRTSQMTKEERLAYAQSHGLNSDQAAQFANTDRTNTYNDTFWDRVARFFGGKLGSEYMQESLDLADSSLINELLNAQREQDYNSEAAQAARLRAAGINPDLDGGASLSPSSASQIDDEVLGSGLSDSLSAVQQGPGNFQTMASVLMDGATSVLGLVNGGFGIENMLLSMDRQSLSDLFEFGKGIESLTFDPLSPVYKEYVDDNGKVDFKRYSRENFPVVTSRYKDIVRRIEQGVNSPEAIARRYEAGKRRTGSMVGISGDYSTINAQSPQLSGAFFGDKNDDVLYPFRLNALNDPDYQQYVTNVAELFKQKLEGDVAAQKIYNRYQTDLQTADFGKKKALYDQYTMEMNNLKLDLQKKAVTQVNNTFQKLIDDAQDGKWMSNLLLQSVISGSFNQFGLGDPYGFVREGAQAIGKIAGAFIPGL